MAKSKGNLLKNLSSKTRSAMRTSSGPAISFKPVHAAIQNVRQQLIDNIPEEDEILKERFITAIRNLDVARVALECNQSLSPTDYNIEPWNHMKAMATLMSRKSGTSKKKR